MKYHALIWYTNVIIHNVYRERKDIMRRIALFTTSFAVLQAFFIGFFVSRHEALLISATYGSVRAYRLIIRPWTGSISSDKSRIGTRAIARRCKTTAVDELRAIVRATGDIPAGLFNTTGGTKMFRTHIRSPRRYDRRDICEPCMITSESDIEA